MKRFIITVDTEGDALWNSTSLELPSTENARYIPRFQELCERFGMKPTYLINYEMAKDDAFAAYVSEKAQQGKCEIGMHLHAWNTPPSYPLQKGSDPKQGLPYVTEYPEEVMAQKVAFLTSYIRERTGVQPRVTRSGRWATDERFFRVLKAEGYLADCSVTPHFSWRGCLGYGEGVEGNDYTAHSHKPYVLERNDDGALWEIPMTIAPLKYISVPKSLSGGRVCLRRMLKGETVWMRFLGKESAAQHKLLKRTEEYTMFMLHSSELLPGGSPYFPTAEATERFFKQMERLFKKAAKTHCGSTLSEYVTSLERSEEK